LHDADGIVDRKGQSARRSKGNCKKIGKKRVIGSLQGLAGKEGLRSALNEPPPFLESGKEKREADLKATEESKRNLGGGFPPAMPFVETRRSFTAKRSRGGPPNPVCARTNFQRERKNIGKKKQCKKKSKLKWGVIRNFSLMWGKATHAALGKSLDRHCRKLSGTTSKKRSSKKKHDGKSHGEKRQ